MTTEALFFGELSFKPDSVYRKFPRTGIYPYTHDTARYTPTWNYSTHTSASVTNEKQR